MYSASDLRKGLKIELEGVPFEIVDFQFVKPGKGMAMYKCRIKNLFNGNTIDKTFREVDRIGKPDMEERELHYSYAEGDHFVFMDERTFEQISIPGQIIAEKKYFLSENLEVSVLFHNGQAITINLPSYIENTVAETEPGARGDTATNVLKPAKLANGFEFGVPLFINQGDVVRIDTRTGKYFDRVSKG
jgi:elongation factor P